MNIVLELAVAKKGMIEIAPVFLLALISAAA
jgi:hypothetical protein